MLESTSKYFFERQTAGIGKPTPTFFFFSFECLPPTFERHFLLFFFVERVVARVSRSVKGGIFFFYLSLLFSLRFSLGVGFLSRSGINLFLSTFG